MPRSPRTPTLGGRSTVSAQGRIERDRAAVARPPTPQWPADRDTAPVISRSPVPVETAPPAPSDIGPMLRSTADLDALREDIDRLARQETQLVAQLDAATAPRDREALRLELDRVQDAIREGEAMQKRANFKRIGEPRVAAAIRAIELLWPLADRSRYGYLERDIVKLEDTLTSVVVTTVELFRRGRGRVATFHFDNGNGFTYDEEAPPDEPDEEEG